MFTKRELFILKCNIMNTLETQKMDIDTKTELYQLLGKLILLYSKK